MKGEEGLDKSVGPSRVPTASEYVQPMIKPELIEIRDDKQANLKDEMPLRKFLQRSSRKMPAMTRPEVVEFAEAGLESFGGDLNLVP